MEKAYESERVYEINSEEWFLGRMLGIPQSALKEKIEKTKPQHIAADHSLQMISNLEKKLSELRGEIYQTMRKSPGDEEERNTTGGVPARDLLAINPRTKERWKANNEDPNDPRYVERYAGQTDEQAYYPNVEDDRGYARKDPRQRVRDKEWEARQWDDFRRRDSINLNRQETNDDVLPEKTRTTSPRVDRPTINGPKASPVPLSTPEDKSRELAPTAGTTNNKLKASFGESTHQTYRLIEDEGHMLRRGLTAENYEMIKGLAVVLRISETEVLHRLEKNGVL